MLNWFLSVDWANVAANALVVVGAASVFVKAVAPLTKWTGDDKLARFLDRVLALAGRLALNPKK